MIHHIRQLYRVIPAIPLYAYVPDQLIPWFWLYHGILLLIFNVFIYCNNFFTFFSFKIDQNYVGQPPAIEVTVTNLNDNIDKQFLSGMLEKCGVYDDIIIYYHPTTNKHLGVARIVFENTKAARSFVEKYNQKSVMGKVCRDKLKYYLILH